MDNRPEFVLDTQNRQYQLKTLLGKGGQGEVWKTNDPEIVIKICTDQSGNYQMGEKGRKSYGLKLDKVRTLDLPESIHVAMPLAPLQSPYRGFSMRLMTDMQELMAIMMRVTPDSYRDSGGLLRRLILLRELARVLEQLHSRGIVYCDLSPRNVFISSDPENHEVWLIDPDNMAFENELTAPVRTPRYSAPEINRFLQPNTAWSDAYSFALLAFELLTLCKPFEGRILLEGLPTDQNGTLLAQDDDSGDDDDWGDEWQDEAPEKMEPDGGDMSGKDNYDKADAGLIPWIDDPDDDRNRTTKGLPRPVLLTTRLRELFQRTFSEEGRTVSASRPSMRQWYDALDEAVGLMVGCPACGQTYRWVKAAKGERGICPWCGADRPPCFKVKLLNGYRMERFPFEPNYDKGAKIKMLTKQVRVIPQRLSAFYMTNRQILEPLFEEPEENLLEFRYDSESARYTVRSLTAGLNAWYQDRKMGQPRPLPCQRSSLFGLTLYIRNSPEGADERFRCIQFSGLS